MRNNEEKYIAKLIAKARESQKKAEEYTQEAVDELATAVAWTAIKRAAEFAKSVVAETGMGDPDDKIVKINNKVRGCLHDLKPVKTVGIIETDETKGIVRIAKPVGVVGAMIPMTNAEITPVLKAMCALKARNAIVFSPHPKSKRSVYELIESIRTVVEDLGYPPDLLQCIPNPTKELSCELMKQCDLVVATGGAGILKKAYSSGKPAYGVGAGNAVVVVDETANLGDAARKIAMGKTFDLATSCSSENSIVVKESIYQHMLLALQREGGYLTSPEEKAALEKALWHDGELNRDIVAQKASKIAKYAGLPIPEDKNFIIVEENHVGKDYLFSGEKLSVVLTVYKYRDFEEAISKVTQVTEFQGMGHSCGIHSFNEKHIMDLALRTKTSRVMIRQSMAIGNGGSWENGMPFTTSLGCGTWGGSITNENISVKHFLNVTWVSSPIKAVVPTDEELFGDYWRRHGGKRDVKKFV